MNGAGHVNRQYDRAKELIEGGWKKYRSIVEFEIKS